MPREPKRRRKGHGSITQRGRDRWAGHVTLDGKRQYFSGRTEKEVDRLIRDAVLAHERGEPIVDRRVTVAKFLQEWIEGPARQRLRDTTYNTYRMYVEKFLIPGLGSHKLAQLQPEHIDRFLANLKGTRRTKQPKPISARTKVQIRAILRSALTWGEKRGRVARNVARLSTAPRVERYDLNPLTVEQARRLVEAASDHHLGAIFVLTLDTGARQGEVLGLRWRDIDLEGCEVQFVKSLQRVNGQPSLNDTKTTSSRRTVGFTEKTAELLAKRKAAQNREKLRAGKRWTNRAGLVFTTDTGEPMAGSTVHKAYQRFLVANGLPKQRFHDLRHASASFLLAQGVPAKVVSERLGHANIGVTLNVYGHLAQEMQRQATEAMAGVLSG